jgi:hypothetical protein
MVMMNKHDARELGRQNGGKMAMISVPNGPIHRATRGRFITEMVQAEEQGRDHQITMEIDAQQWPNSLRAAYIKGVKAGIREMIAHHNAEFCGTFVRNVAYAA